MARAADRDANRVLTERMAEVFEQYGKMRAGVADLQRRMQSLEETARTPDGMVEATVDSRGRLVRLHFDRSAYQEYEPAKLAEVTTAIIARATEQVGRRVQDLLGEFLPAESGALAFVRSNDFNDLLRRSDDLVDRGRADGPR